MFNMLITLSGCHQLFQQFHDQRNLEPLPPVNTRGQMEFMLCNYQMWVILKPLPITCLQILHQLWMQTWHSIQHHKMMLQKGPYSYKDPTLTVFYCRTRNDKSIDIWALLKPYYASLKFEETLNQRFEWDLFIFFVAGQSLVLQWIQQGP